MESETLSFLHYWEGAVITVDNVLHGEVRQCFGVGSTAGTGREHCWDGKGYWDDNTVQQGKGYFCCW